jgi:hypothetical protein
MINHEAGSQWPSWIECEPGDVDSCDDRLTDKPQHESGKFNWTHTPLLWWHETQARPSCGDGGDDTCRNIGGLSTGKHEPESEETETA